LVGGLRIDLPDVAARNLLIDLPDIAVRNLLLRNGGLLAIGDRDAWRRSSQQLTRTRAGGDDELE
jgi:hypothetical protein